MNCWPVNPSVCSLLPSVLRRVRANRWLAANHCFPPGLRVGPVNGLAGRFPGGFYELACPSDRVARARINSHRAIHLPPKGEAPGHLTTSTRGNCTPARKCSCHLLSTPVKPPLPVPPTRCCARLLLCTPRPGCGHICFERRLSILLTINAVPES